MTPLVSVLMTAYNREKYISAAIDSVLASTYKNWELIIVDDRSGDKTLEIARAYEQKDARIRVFLNENNLGDYPNRNQAAAYAAGKYLKYVDADDYIYPWGLQLLVGMMEQYPEAGWGLCSLIQIPETPYPILLDSRKAYEFHYFHRTRRIFDKAPLSAILRRDAFDRVGGFSPMRMVGDFDMWHRLALYYPVLLMPDGIVWYREHEEQEMSSWHKYARTYGELMVKYIRHPDSPLSEAETKTVISRRKRDLMKSTINDLVRLRFRNAAANFKTWQFFIGK